MRLLLLSALAACAAAPRAGGSFTGGGGCAAPEYRALDFWLGDWEVRDAKGDLEGTTTIAGARACGGPESGQLDFWVGDWDVRLKQRSPGGDAWQEAHGTNRIRKVLGGCAVLESFEADGPDAMWAGKSVSQYVPAEKRWRQVWVDDQGSWLAFTGGKQGDQFILQTEPVGAAAGRTLRMVFHEIRPDHISWRWERAEPGGATWTPLLLIEYRRSGTARH